MGSPLGPILADFFLSKLENGPLNNLIRKFSFYCRYMDDTFILCDNASDRTTIITEFNEVHPAMKFTCEEESQDRIAFLDVLLTRKPDGSIKRNLHRKSTWTGQYTHFHSFVPIKYKRNLVKTLSHRVRAICSEEVIKDELNIVYDTLIENGYPDKFIKKHMTKKAEKDDPLSVNKKPLYIRLQFKGDKPSELITKKLRKAVQRTFNAGELHILFSTRPMVLPRLKDEVPRLATSNCIYQFNCACGASYVGRCSRNLIFRAREHIPLWLSKGVVKSINSSILDHLVQTGHKASVDESFSIIYRVPNKLPKSSKHRLLQTAEAIAIRLKQPALCVQKKQVQPLLLPWPSVETINS
ncbi:unnamed protein product [Trichobilharzia szidati]|nr:unnamed protein product [Trichobilharzia szidati]